MIFERNRYLNELIASQGNGLVKVVTGVKGCGKSFLLFDIWHHWLLEQDVPESHIIEVDLEDLANEKLRDRYVLLDYINSIYR